MPSNVQIHRQAPLNDAKILKETETTIYKLPQKYDSIISKGCNDICQTDLIKMHIATIPDATAIAAWPCPLAVKHHDVLKNEIKIY